MGETIIPLADLRYAAALPPVPADAPAPNGLLSDRLGRALRDLRISVTDRCNFRCTYCMPKQLFDANYKFLPQSSLLSFEEITRTARIFVAHGVRKLRLTGGEPLLRKHVEDLVAMLAALRTPDGEALDITLTTNGSVLARHVRDRFGPGVVLRFIEYMDVGASNGWRMDEVLPSAQVVQAIDRVFPLQALQASAPGETAERWAYRDGGGEIGVISSVTQAFCQDCNRARLSTEGKLFLCLFAGRGHDLRALLRGTLEGQAYSDAQIAAAIGLIWSEREDRYSELRAAQSPAADPAERRVEMHYIGG